MAKVTKKIILLGLFALFVFAPVEIKAEPKVEIHLFWTQGCPHCLEEKEFLSQLKEKYPQITLNTYEVGQNNQNHQLMEKFAQQLDTNVPGVPFTVIGDDYVIGYQSDQTTGQEIENLIRQQLGVDSQAKVKLQTIDLFLIGEINLEELSLPALSIVLGLLDGFNPCAMWVLVFLISLLLGMKNRTRRWALGITFLITSALVYFAIMAAWLNFFLLIGAVIWVRLIIGLVALGAGGYNLREYWVNKQGTCKVTHGERRKKIFERLRNITHERNFWLALGGIILLAIAVNVVELICSAGLPAVFTQVLTLNNLAMWKYYFYLGLYIVFFLIDDLFVFFAAMITLEMTGIDAKYSRYSSLIGGILMFVLGFLLIFKPGWLMFG